MASALVAALASPIREVAALVGPGWSGDATAELAGVRDALAEVSAATAEAWNQADAQWTGVGAAGAAEFAAATVAATERLAHRAGHLGATANTAAEAVSRAGRRLRRIVEEFEARAAALEPYLDSPGVAEELIEEARRALAEAIGVVDELSAELDDHATAIASPAPPVATAPAGYPTTRAPGLGSAASLPTSPWSGGGALDSAMHDTGRHDGGPAAARHDEPLADPGRFGDGIAVRLPDGGTAMAPNPVAASAVRHALTQLGVPYVWGGTTPGVGLDCSGLTQWAYHQAGLDIPRLAQEQDIGAAIDRGAIRPGDLAVWDGHVAMIVGNGLMIEAGDPVQLSPVRTTNAGQGFHGFFRPTT